MNKCCEEMYNKWKQLDESQKNRYRHTHAHLDIHIHTVNHALMITEDSTLAKIIGQMLLPKM